MIAPKKTEQPSWERFATKRTANYAAIALAVLAALVWALRTPPVGVDLMQVARAPMRVTVDEEGKTRVKQVFVVSAPVSGKLTALNAVEGDQVTTGFVVAEIEAAQDAA